LSELARRRTRFQIQDELLGLGDLLAVVRGRLQVHSLTPEQRKELEVFITEAEAVMVALREELDAARR
jgi:hypothetical protein